MLPLNDRISVHVLLGPSFFTVSQDVVEDVTLVEAAPFTTVNATANVVERKESPVGFNIGADVAYNAYTRDRLKVGAGMFLRFAGASADLQVFDNTVESELGGFQIGFGVRTRF
jgi:hypothetical protein